MFGKDSAPHSSEGNKRILGAPYKVHEGQAASHSHPILLLYGFLYTTRFRSAHALKTRFFGKMAEHCNGTLLKKRNGFRHIS